MHLFRRLLEMLRPAPPDEESLATAAEALSLLNEINAVLAEADMSEYDSATRGTLRRLRRAKQRAHQIKPSAPTTEVHRALIAMLQAHEFVLLRILEGKVEDRSVLEHARRTANVFEREVKSLRRRFRHR